MEILNFEEKIIANYIESIRPPVEVRKQLDIGYTFENNELIIFEIRPFFMDETKIINSPFVRTKFVKSRKIWKIYWMRASGKWELYEPDPIVKDLPAFFEILDLDEYGCFRG